MPSSGVVGEMSNVHLLDAASKSLMIKVRHLVGLAVDRVVSSRLTGVGASMILRLTLGAKQASLVRLDHFLGVRAAVVTDPQPVPHRHRTGPG